MHSSTNWYTLQVKRTTLTFLALLVGSILAGVYLRGFNILNTPFSFDQVQIAQAADEIAAGNPTLIGPRTGPASMFTGPLIYYVTAVLSLGMEMPYAIAYTALFLSFVTGVTIAGLSVRYLERSHAVIPVILWAFSPFLIALDRIVWNPNIMVLAAALSFFPLLKKKQLWFGDMVLLAVGTFLGYQAHFSGLLLVGFVIAGLIVRKLTKTDTQCFVSVAAGVLAILGLVASVLPTVLFDYRNNWQNARGLLEMVSNKDKVSDFGSFVRFPHKVFIIVETFGKVFFGSSPFWVLVLAGFAATGAFFKKQIEERSWNNVLIFGGWLASVAVIYSLYRESTPEYYFLLLIPVFLVAGAYIFMNAFSRSQRVVLLSLFVVYGTLVSRATNRDSQGLSLANQLKIVDAVEALQTPIGQVVYDIKPVESLGIRYLMKSYEAEVAAAGNIGELLHIIYPLGSSNIFTTQVAHDVAIWVDTRTDANVNYLTTDSFILKAPAGVSFYRITGGEEKMFGYDGWLVTQATDGEQKVIGSVFVEKKVMVLENDTARKLNPANDRWLLEGSDVPAFETFLEIEPATQPRRIMITQEYVFVTTILDQELLELISL